jgi:hypothetical protein
VPAFPGRRHQLDLEPGPPVQHRGHGLIGRL